MKMICISIFSNHFYYFFDDLYQQTRLKYKEIFGDPMVTVPVSGNLASFGALELLMMLLQ